MFENCDASPKLLTARTIMSEKKIDDLGETTQQPGGKPIPAEMHATFAAFKDGLMEYYREQAEIKAQRAENDMKLKKQRFSKKPLYLSKKSMIQISEMRLAKIQSDQPIDSMFSIKMKRVKGKGYQMRVRVLLGNTNSSLNAQLIKKELKKQKRRIKKQKKSSKTQMKKLCCLKKFGRKTKFGRTKAGKFENCETDVIKKVSDDGLGLDEFYKNFNKWKISET